AGISNQVKVKLRKLRAEDILEDGTAALEGAHGLLVPGGFGERGLEGKITAIRWARENNVPFFGICLGMQCAVIEVARHVCGLEGAHTLEHTKHSPHPVINLMKSQEGVQDKGGTMRLGAYDCDLVEGTKIHSLYGQSKISERHRHRFEYNNEYRERLEAGGLIVSGVHPELGLVETVELENHPFFIGVQYHPEFKTSPLNPHPIFNGFAAAALEYSQSRNPDLLVPQPSNA
ncbi:MAG: CTP synthase, partial [Planctomycetota bacterium]